MASASGSPAGSIIRVTLTGVGFTVVVVVLLLWLAGTFHPKLDDRPAHAIVGRPVTDGVALVEVRTLRQPYVETAVGTVRAVHEAAVASKLLAKVLSVHVQAGQEVQVGDVLVRLDDEDLVAQRKSAEAGVAAAAAALENAQTEFDRVRPLYEQGIEAKSEFDRTQTQLRVATAELERAEQTYAYAQTMLSYATITSPITGRVFDKQVEAGDTVQPGQVLVTLYDPLRMQLVASVRESLTQRLAVGQPIGVEIEAIGKQCQGMISEIVPEAESASRTFSVKVTGPCPTGVYSGMFGRLLIPLDEQDVVVVPRAAVRRVGQLDLVDVVESTDQGRMLRRRAVQLGRAIDEDIQVLSGLSPGEQVALPSRADAS